MKPVILLLAKAALAAKPREEMEGLCEAVSKRESAYDVTYVLQELGSPSLRERLNELAEKQVPEVIIVSLIVPMEPAFPNWIRRSVHRWIKVRGDQFYPKIKVANPAISKTDNLAEMISSLTKTANESDVVQEAVKVPAGSVVPAQKHRMLVCMGGACNDAGASALYSHVRAEQDRLKLKDKDTGMTSCKTSCLGPCSLAPVIQVWPEGTIYGGVTEKDVDRIIDSHIEKGKPLEDISYLPTGKKQSLR